jgi:regulator of RNase E activity RraA
MIEEPPKLTVRRPDRRPTAEQCAAFATATTSFVVDAMGGQGALSYDVKPVFPARVVGPALTAGNGPADIMASLAALAFLQKGDVLIIGAQGHLGCAAGGDVLCGMARNSGAAGLVTDGALRDAEGIKTVGLPAWCRGITPASPYTTGPGTVGLPVTLAGQQVETGDIVVADTDGVVVVPFAQIDRVIDRLKEVQRLEAEMDAEVADGLRRSPKVDDWLADPAITAFVDQT